MIDIFPAESEQEAVRVALFDDEIESIRGFDPLTGELGRPLSRYTIFPKTHYVTPRATLLAAVDQIRIDLKQRSRPCARRTGCSRRSGSNSAPSSIWR